MGTFLEIMQALAQLIPAVLTAVKEVTQATGASPSAATAEVVNHLTPGAPNSPTLSAGK